MVPLDKEMQWVNVKQKTFRQKKAHSGIIRHIEELFRHIQTYSKPNVTLAYLKLWCIQNPDIIHNQKHIQNPRIFRTLAYSEFEAYSEPCQTSTMKRFAKTVNGYNYFRKL